MNSVGDTDPYNLHRFVEAQGRDYQRALSEIRGGHKRSHWMWYIFPQIAGLGRSSTATYYAIESSDEARAYLSHPILGPRLIECVEAVLGITGKSATEIFGSPDDLKLKSSATLFAYISPQRSTFQRIIDKFYNGERDDKTIQLIEGS